MAKMLPAVLLFALLSAAPGLAGEKPEADPEASRQACDAARSFVLEQIAANPGRTIVFDFTPDVFAPLMLPAGSLRWSPAGEAATGFAPPPQLVDSFTRESHRSAVEHCPSIRQLLAERRIAFGRRAAKKAERAQKAARPGEPPLILTIVLPTVSADGRHAVLSMAHSFGFLDGAGALYHLSRDDAGQWRVASGIRLWVS